MAQPIDLEAVRRAYEKFDQLLADHPELGDVNPERAKAFAQWRQDNLKEQHPCHPEPSPKKRQAVHQAARKRKNTPHS